MKPLALALALSLASPLFAAALHVSPRGDNRAAGTEAAPWRTLQHAADQARPGDTVLAHAGTYRESVVITRGGSAGQPVRFAAAADGPVVISGCEPVASPWQLHRGEIYRTPVAGAVLQVFAAGRPQVWARWPNRSLDHLWDRDAWAHAGPGSRYGLLIDPQLAATGVDWSGALATLNVAHQFITWTRPVQTFTAATASITYARDLVPVTHYADKTAEWEDDRYFLAGKLEALDAPGEWFHDEAAGLLYFWAPDGGDPASYGVEVKRRPFGFELRAANHIALAGIRFLGCTLAIRGDDNLVEDCVLDHPVFVRHLSEPGTAQPSDTTAVRGDRNTIRRCTIAGASTTALELEGRRNLVEDCLIRDAGWDGSLAFPAVRLANPSEDRADGNVVRYCTIRDGGSSLINYQGPGNVIEYCHLHDGGRITKDCALIQGGSPRAVGTTIRYNWIHGCHPYPFKVGVPFGLGLRGDDQTRGLIVHHNVVWDCGRDGITIKGDRNEVYHNTVFAIGPNGAGRNGIALHLAPEPLKSWLKQAPLLTAQNGDSRVVNNATSGIASDRRTDSPLAHPRVTGNVIASHLALDLVDPDNFDFRPRAGSPMIDAAVSLPGINDRFNGRAPDLGACESGAAPWRAGRRTAPHSAP